MANKYVSHAIDVQLDCEWMTVDVWINCNLSDNDGHDIVELESVTIQATGQDITRFVNHRYIDDLIDEFLSNGDQKDYGDG